ncbi:MFS transporter [Fructilactobacillus carniphilus]|uniref:MFS transporter n=1 Tax=Fructilactobacillus carniphilus TaxID=2940297 RepID=A0ABY5BYJ2_9LACO|nr:MFS transporter [Fructilactobacillus carniphilus]USS91301.1 MFS transporter [Fructilactobacillus carniphilus]
MSKNKKFFTILGLFFGVFVTGADSFIISPMLPEIAHSFATSITLAAYGVTIYAICFAVGSPLFGPLGNRYKKKVVNYWHFNIFGWHFVMWIFSHLN